MVSSVSGRCNSAVQHVLQRAQPAAHLRLVDARLLHQLPDSRYALTPLGHRAYQALRPFDPVVQGVGGRI